MAAAESTRRATDLYRGALFQLIVRTRDSRTAAQEYTGSSQTVHRSCVVRRIEVAYSDPSVN